MAGNVVTHGFSNAGKKHAVDIRVVYKDNEPTLQIRDNCKSFDPHFEHAKSKDSEDVGNIGIRLNVQHRQGSILSKSSGNERTDDQDVILSAVTCINVVQ